MVDNSLLEAAADSVLNADKVKAEEIAHQVIELGLDPVEVITNGFTVGIVKVGEHFEYGKLFLPELIRCAEVMKIATKILNKAISGENQSSKGKVILATVEGDNHDIGKGIVASLLVANGLEVKDLGRDASIDKIVDKAEEFQADIIGTSALLTTTMIQQKKLEDLLKKENLKNKYATVVGGAPVTKIWADKIGASAYAENAVEGVSQIVKLIEAKSSKS